MIGYLSGLIIDIQPQEKAMTVLTQGVGYRVFVSNELLSKVRNDEKIQLYIHMSVREDAISLYGFKNREELTFFNQLISVSGVGPKIALDILGAPLHLTQNAILTGDTDMLKKIKGLGQKTAERIVVELKNKVVPVKLEGTFSSAMYNEDAVLALEGLGYDKMQVVKAIAKMPPEIKGTEAIVKYFLKQTK